MRECPFCSRIETGDVITRSDLAAAFYDGFPISSGHVLVVPVRHEADFFTLSVDEQVAIWDLVREMRDVLEAEHHPSAFNVGINIGADAGQTIGHAHLHLIPRYEGDVDDPRGGVRWIIPEKAPYWSDQ